MHLSSFVFSFESVGDQCTVQYSLCKIGFSLMANMTLMVKGAIFFNLSETCRCKHSSNLEDKFQIVKFQKVITSIRNQKIL